MEEDYASKQIAEQTSGNIILWIQQLKQKYDDDKYYYDSDEALRFNKFVGKLELDKGKKGEKIKLLKFQFEICTSIICVKSRETNLRRFRECHINVPRKQGKSFMIACIVTYLYFCKNEFGSETIISANSTQQASLLFNTIHHMIKTNKILKKHVKITDSRKYMYKKNMNAYLRVISSDASNADSYASFVSVLDEIHEAKNGNLYDKMRTGMGIWDEPLLITITTASSGQDPNNLEFEIYNYAKSIEKGEIQDESFFYAIFEAEPNCNILDEKQWFASNPALGTFRKYDDLKSLAIKATKLKTREAAFRRLYLNQHVALDGEGAINLNLWKECITDIKLEELYGMPCWCGLDLSAVQDITAFIQVFYDQDRDKYIIYPHLFTPKNTIDTRTERDNVRYDMYVKQRYITALDGNHIKFEQLQSYIKELSGHFDLQEIGFDRWGALGIISALEDDFTVIMMGQGMKTMSPAIKDFENLLIDGKLIIANNPVLTWMAGNVVATIDPSGNVKYDKAKSKNKIDGIIAMLMGLSRAIANTNDNKVDINKIITDEYLDQLYTDY